MKRLPAASYQAWHDGLPPHNLPDLLTRVIRLLSADGFANPLSPTTTAMIESWAREQHEQSDVRAAVERLELLEHARLTTRERTALALWLVGLTQEEIGKVLDIRRTTVETLLGRIRTKLRQTA